MTAHLDVFVYPVDRDRYPLHRGGYWAHGVTCHVCRWATVFPHTLGSALEIARCHNRADHPFSPLSIRGPRRRGTTA